MVENFVSGFKSSFNVCEIHDPATVVSHGTGYEKRHCIGVTVEPATLVERGYVGQEVGCFKCKFFKDFHRINGR